jgi:Zn-dependent protease
MSMNWSFRVARVAGIDIKIHITFFLILILGAFLIPGSGIQGMLFGITLILLLFFCVTLHELGHSLAAQYFGIPVREIILLPLGGVALLGRNPSKPSHELLIALAGPLVNVLIAAVLWLIVGPASSIGEGALTEGSAMSLSLTTLLQWLLSANIALAVFNMIPAFPLDGGRVFRAILAMFVNYQQATRIATFVGQIIAVGLGVFAILNGSILLALVAVFVFFGAGQENVEGQARTVLTTLRVGDAYNKHAIALNIGDRVSKVVDYILTSYQPDFAVMQGSNPIGIVTREDVLRSLATDMQDAYVTSIMRRDIVHIEATATLDEVRQTMSEKSARVVAVYEGSTYLGLVSIEDISEAFAVASFLQRQQEARRARQVEPGTGAD